MNDQQQAGAGCLIVMGIICLIAAVGAYFGAAVAFILFGVVLISLGLAAI